MRCLDKDIIKAPKISGKINIECREQVNPLRTDLTLDILRMRWAIADALPFPVPLQKPDLIINA